MGLDYRAVADYLVGIGPASSEEEVPGGLSPEGRGRSPRHELGAAILDRLAAYPFVKGLRDHSGPQLANLKLTRDQLALALEAEATQDASFARRLGERRTS